MSTRRTLIQALGPLLGRKVTSNMQGARKNRFRMETEVPGSKPDRWIQQNLTDNDYKRQGLRENPAVEAASTT